MLQIMGQIIVISDIWKYWLSLYIQYIFIVLSRSIAVRKKLLNFLFITYYIFGG
jgi:hypothetical protein